MLQLALTGRDNLRRYHAAVKLLGERRMLQIYSRVTNHAGNKGRTQVRRALSPQTGLPRKVIVRAVKTRPSNPGTLTYRLEADGGDIALKFFKPRETRAGVSAAPFGKRQVFAGTFLKGGRFPGRVPLSMGGHVFKRSGAGRLPIARQKSGVVIPAEMVRGATADAWEKTALPAQAQRLQSEIRRVTKGVVS